MIFLKKLLRVSYLFHILLEANLVLLGR